VTTASRCAAEKLPPRILVVDDVPMFRELERLFLSRIGQVRTASTIEQALREARVHSPEVILLDLHLQDAASDGAVPGLLAAAGPKAVVVMVTNGSREDHACAIHAGAADVLAKPLSREMLLQSISRFVGRTQHPAGLPRVSVEGPVQVRARTREFRGTMRNISRGGLFIEAACEAPEGAEVSLAFDLPGTERRLEPTARVMWKRIRPNGGPVGLGVRFVELDGPSGREIENFVHERSDEIMPWLTAGR